MNEFSIGAAIDFFEQGVYNAKTEGFYTEDKLQGMINHCLQVAACAEMISLNIKGINPETSYALGLLHDYGKFVSPDTQDKFHGTEGYWCMMKKGWELAANICITHTFQEGDFFVEDYPSYGIGNVKKAKKIIKGIEYNDYSRVVQAADLIVNVTKFDTIKERMIFIKNKYNADIKILKRKYKDSMKLKKYLDEKCGCDIYKLLGIS